MITGKADHAEVECSSASPGVIGSGDGGPEGDFAIVIEEPLKPASTGSRCVRPAPGKVVRRCRPETAIVSVPADAGGQVLAMVEEHRRASPS